MSWTITSSAYDFEKDGLYYNIISETTVECCGGGQSPTDATYRKTDVEIPSTVKQGLKSYTVEKIADYAWGQVQYLVWIKNLVLPETIKEIGIGAFRDANNIESINLPDGLISIGDYAMQGPKLSEYIFPRTLKSIGTRCFNSKLRTVIITSSEPPMLKEETFAYQNGGIYIPTGLRIFVPSMERYAEMPYYKEFIESLVSFTDQSFIYSGEQPQINYNVNLPDGYHLSIDLSKIPVNAGDYELILEGEINGNILADIPLSLVISKADLRITANNASRQYGENNPDFNAVIEGLQNDENIDDVLIDGYNLFSRATAKSDIGEYPIELKSDASTNYNIQFKPGKLNVTQAPIRISIGCYNREYGLDNPLFKLSFDGLKSCDELPKWDKLPVFYTDATKLSNVGVYPVSVMCEPHNYEILSCEYGILTITKAKATISANNKERLYFEQNPQFDFSISGLLNDDTESCLTTYPSYNCEASILSDAGVYEIMPVGAMSKNYIFEYVPGNLIVNKRQLMVSVGNYTRVYGEDNPSFDVDYTGFVNNEDASTLSQSVTVFCPATSLSDVGTYPIDITGGNATNYQISKYKSGTLTITKANQSIIWDQDLSNIELYSQVELQATSDTDLPISYEISPNNVANLYSNAGRWYLDCYGRGTVIIRATQKGDKNHNDAPIITKKLVVYGNEENDSSNPQIYLNIDEPGTLSTMISENKKYHIKNLRLTGYLNGTDINFIREMAGSDSYGNTTPGVLEALDISGCTIVSGGRSYYQLNRTTEKVVGNSMFYNCKVLTTLRIPDNTISIGDYAFADCERLSVISIPNCVKSHGIQSFRNDISLLRLPMSRKLEEIGDMAYSGCNGLTEITIPSSVTSIGLGIVKDCQNITQINVEVGNINYASRDGVLFNSNFDDLIIYPVNHAGVEYVVPEGVDQIASYAFVNAKELKSVSLPSTLSMIGQDAFIGCINLNRLQVLALTPPTCQNNCFDNISKTRCNLQVPIGCRSYYWVAPVWSEFNKIMESDFSRIEDVYLDNLHIGIIDGKISVSGCHEDMTVRIYQINGTLLYQGQPSSGEIQFEPLYHGVYIIMIGNKTFKVIVK